MLGLDFDMDVHHGVKFDMVVSHDIGALCAFVRHSSIVCAS